MRTALRLRSKSGIHRLITGLEERGYIRRLAYRARALEVICLPNGARLEPSSMAAPTEANIVQFGRPAEQADEDSTVTLPLYGRIAAGTPISLARSLDPRPGAASSPWPRRSLRLEVVGDPMCEAGIQDGDLVVIERADGADNGDIVVALIDDSEVTLKRLRCKGQTVALEAANPEYETRIFGPNRVKVQGRLVGLMRRY